MHFFTPRQSRSLSLILNLDGYPRCPSNLGAEKMWKNGRRSGRERREDKGSRSWFLNHDFFYLAPDNWNAMFREIFPNLKKISCTTMCTNWNNIFFFERWKSKGIPLSLKKNVPSNGSYGSCEQTRHKNLVISV